jgi:rhodanese-related sulfurtransferase
MKSEIKILSVFILLLVLTLDSGCLKETSSPSAPGFDYSAELLTYIELNRNLNSISENSYQVSVDEVYANMQNYLLIDIRQYTDFTSGHIEGAKNIIPGQIISYLKSADITKFHKVIIIGSTGQDGAYVTCLLRLWGLNNVYYLNYGMGYWNRAFSREWLEGKGSYPNRNYRGFNYPQNAYSSLPKISFNPASANVSQRLEERVQLLLEEGFDNIKTTMKETFDKFFNYGMNKFIDCYMICDGPEFLYIGASGYSGSYGHPGGAVLYDPLTDYKSTSKLQTIPSGRPIVIYSLNGQHSAFIAAYLRVLGYETYSINFGSWSLWGSRFISSVMPGLKKRVDYFKNQFTDYGYWLYDDKGIGVSVVRDYPYVTGE